MTVSVVAGPSVARLLDWCDLVTTDYTGVKLTKEGEADVKLRDWWGPGHGLCAVIARFRPDLMQYHALGESETETRNDHEY